MVKVPGGKSDEPDPVAAETGDNLASDPWSTACWATVSGSGERSGRHRRDDGAEGGPARGALATAGASREGERSDQRKANPRRGPDDPGRTGVSHGWG